MFKRFTIGVAVRRYDPQESLRSSWGLGYFPLPRRRLMFSAARTATAVPS